MSFYKLKYGSGEVDIPLSKEQIAYTVEPNKIPMEKYTPEEALRLALDTPYGTGRLEEICHPGEKILLVIADSTRAWQKPGLLLKAILERLTKAGISGKDISILSARGTHRPQSDEELRTLVTPEIYDMVKTVRDHDPKDKNGLVPLGTTSRGTPVLVNRMATEADRVILIGSVLHHFLAGFSGGRKSVLPGIAGYETVQKNHALSLAPGGGFLSQVRSGNTDGNPVAEDMCEAAALLHPDFILNTVVDENSEIVRAFAGDIFQAHKAACDLVNRLNCVKIPHRCPVVIASAGGYPKDINVYQPLKTLCHMKECATPGGTLIMLSESREGIGSPDTEEQILRYHSPAERETALRAHYTIGGATGYLYADAAENYNFIYVTILPPELFKNTKMKIVPTLEEALKLIPTPGKDEVCLLPAGSVTLPVVSDCR